MRTYYIFKIKRHFTYLYKNSPSKLYDIFNGVYNLNNINIKDGMNILKQTCNKINKNILNEYIYYKHIDEPSYSKNKGTHIIKNVYKNEFSKIKITSTHIKLKSNKNICSFVKDLKDYSTLFFICDFKNCDYLFISSIDEETLAR